ncbi:MAG: hypothetical protein QW203_05120 [Thermoplasmatales archaeon]
MTTITSNKIITTVTSQTAVYTVNVSASPSTNLLTSTDVTFTVSVSTSDGSAVNGTATLYITSSSEAVLGQWPVTITNGTGSITLDPGLYLAAGSDTQNYYAIFSGVQSNTGTLTFIISVPPTQMTLSGIQSVEAGQNVTFSITSNGSNVSVTLYAYNSSSNAANAPSLTGQLQNFQVTLDTSGSGNITLTPTILGANTYWVAYYSGVLSNILEVSEQVVQPTSISLSASGNASLMTFTVTSQAGTSFSCSLYVYNSASNASNVPSLTGQLDSWVDWIAVNNGTGSIQLVPSAINTKTQYWIAYYPALNLKSNIITVVG